MEESFIFFLDSELFCKSLPCLWVVGGGGRTGGAVSTVLTVLSACTLTCQGDNLVPICSTGDLALLHTKSILARNPEWENKTSVAIYKRNGLINSQQ